MRVGNGIAATVGCALAACAAPPDISIEVSDDGPTVLVGGELFTQLRVSPGTKPFLYPVLAPGGLAVTRGFPVEEREGEAEDHPHHVSLWFAHGDVDGHDFWHGESASIETGRVRIEGERIVSEHAWIAGGEVLVDERRSMAFGATRGARWIDFDLTLTPRSEAMVLGDSKEGTFALRLAPTLRVEGEVAAGRLLDAEGRVDGDVWGERARWVAALGPVEGRDVTVAIFDHPGNPRHPTWWHARQYGLVAANPFGRRAFEGEAAEPGDLRVEGALRLRYRVWVATGRRSAEELDAAWSDYARRLGLPEGRPFH